MSWTERPAPPVLTLEIPLRLPSLANCRMHWRKLMGLKQQQKQTMLLTLAGLRLPDLPVEVTITRLGPRTLDDDNLAGAGKYVRDSIAAAFGADDGSAAFRWVYRQEKSRVYGVRVEFGRL